MPVLQVVQKTACTTGDIFPISYRISWAQCPGSSCIISYAPPQFAMTRAVVNLALAALWIIIGAYEAGSGRNAHSRFCLGYQVPQYCHF